MGISPLQKQPMPTTTSLALTNAMRVVTSQMTATVPLPTAMNVLTNAMVVPLPALLTAPPAEMDSPSPTQVMGSVLLNVELEGIIIMTTLRKLGKLISVAGDLNSHTLGGYLLLSLRRATMNLKMLILRLMLKIQNRSVIVVMLRVLNVMAHPLMIVLLVIMGLAMSGMKTQLLKKSLV